MQIVVAESIYSDCSVYGNCKSTKAITNTVSFSNNTGSVNSSAYWGNYLYSLFDMNSIKSFSYNHTTATYALYDAIWSSTFNETYDATTRQWNGNSSMVYNHTLTVYNQSLVFQEKNITIKITDKPYSETAQPSNLLSITGQKGNLAGSDDGGNGGDLKLEGGAFGEGGDGYSNGNGGNIYLDGGQGTSGGNIYLTGGYTQAGTYAGGNIYLDGGLPGFGANPGSVIIGNTRGDLRVVKNMSVNNTDLFVNSNTGRVGIGTSNPSYKLTLEDNVNGFGGITVNNSNAGNIAIAMVQLINNNNDFGMIYKTSTAFGGYKNILANDFGIYNLAGNMKFLVDGGGNIGFSAGGNSDQMTLSPDGNLNVTSGNITANYFKGSMDWTNLQNFPVACPAGTFVTNISGTITCTSVQETLTSLLVNGNLTVLGNISAFNLCYSNGTGCTSSGTFNETYDMWAYNQSGTGTSGAYNETYNNLLNQQCPEGQVVNGTLSNGTFTCVAAGSTSTGGENNVAILNNVNTYNTVSNTDNRAYPSTALVNNIINYQINNVTGDILPTSTLNYSLGSSIFRWLKGWFASIDVEGDITQTNGNATINNYYGEMYCKNDSGCGMVDLTTPDVYVQMANQTAGNMNGFTLVGGTNLSAQVSGLYKANVKVSVTGGSPAGEFDMKLYVDNVGQNNCYDHHEVSADHISMVANCLVRVNATQNVNIRFDDHASPVTDIMFYSSNVNLVRVGN